MTEILRTIYADCMNNVRLNVHPQYAQMRKMLIEWLVEGGRRWCKRVVGKLVETLVDGRYLRSGLGVARDIHCVFVHSLLMQ